MTNSCGLPLCRMWFITHLFFFFCLALGQEISANWFLFFLFYFSSFAGNKKVLGIYKLQSPFFLNWLEARAGKEIQLFSYKLLAIHFVSKGRLFRHERQAELYKFYFLFGLSKTKVKKKKKTIFFLWLLFLFCQGVYCFMKLPAR